MINSISPKVLADFSFNFIMDAIAKNSSRTAFDENIGLMPDLIFPDIVRPYSLKTPTYLISFENDRIFSHFFLCMEMNFVQDTRFMYKVKMFKLINHIKYNSMKLDKEIKEKINLLLNSDAMNYLETSERLVLKNVLDKKIISELDTENLEKILEKYKKSIKK